MDQRAHALAADGVAYVRTGERDDRLLELSCRALDVLGAAILLVLLAPLLGLIALLIKLDSPGPALFRQRRLGRDAEPFTVNKFRTMHHGVAHDRHREFVLGLINGEHPQQRENSEQHQDTQQLDPQRHGQSPKRGDSQQDGENLEHESRSPRYKMVGDRRMTRFGRVLRRSSLDELPQLWNVLRGEMSLVGPRPPIPYEVEHYPPHWFARFAVKPGVTGLWQVSGRSEVTLEQMVQLDVEYARRRSLWFNVAILLRTVPAVLSGRGAW
jgi:lipopolysaccharide/colanic/teichoic acid biosynthesis glycosyltransferase